MGSARDRETVAEFARSNSWDLTVVGTFNEGLSFSANRNAAVVILDRDLPGKDWRSAVRSFAQSRATPCIILASSVMDDYLFEEIVKQGGFDTIAKPIRTDELRRIGGLAIKYWKSRVARNANG